MNVITEGLLTEQLDLQQSSSSAATVLRCISEGSLVQGLDDRRSVLGSEFRSPPAFCHTGCQPLFSWISGWCVKVCSPKIRCSNMRNVLETRTNVNYV